MSEKHAAIAMEATQPKPTAMVIGAQGFDGLRRHGEQTVDWAALCRLPPFQRFIETKRQNPMGIASDKFAVEVAHALCAEAGGPEALIAEYEAWHAATGMWPHETPYGRPR